MYYMLRATMKILQNYSRYAAEYFPRDDADSESEQDYALFVRSVVLENKLLPFDRTAVARVD
jgi:hypothetical protein